MTTLGERLRIARKRAGLSQFQLATQMGNYTHQMISRIENGESATTVASLAAAARVLDVSTDYLVGLTDDPAPAADRPALPPRQYTDRIVTQREYDFIENFRALPRIVQQSMKTLADGAKEKAEAKKKQKKRAS